jgi:hypothetical protein
MNWFSKPQLYASENADGIPKFDVFSYALAGQASRLPEHKTEENPRNLGEEDGILAFR